MIPRVQIWTLLSSAEETRLTVSNVFSRRTLAQKSLFCLYMIVGVFRCFDTWVRCAQPLSVSVYVSSPVHICIYCKGGRMCKGFPYNPPCSTANCSMLGRVQTSRTKRLLLLLTLHCLTQTVCKQTDSTAFSAHFEQNMAFLNECPAPLHPGAEWMAKSLGLNKLCYEFSGG